MVSTLLLAIPQPLFLTDTADKQPKHPCAAHNRRHNAYPAQPPGVLTPAEALLQPHKGGLQSLTARLSCGVLTETKAHAARIPSSIAAKYGQPSTFAMVLTEPSMPSDYVGLDPRVWRMDGVLFASRWSLAWSARPSKT